MTAVRPAVLAWLERHGEEVLAGACLCVLSTLVFVQVVMRYAFRAPLSWTDEVASWCMVGLVYFGAAFAVRERAHIRVMLAIVSLPRRGGLALGIVADALWLAFNLVMVWQSALLVASFAAQPFYSAALDVNLLWPHLAIPIGFALVSLRMVQIYVQWARGSRDPFVAAH
jgi:TRAP-type C4-dicarboxylate transport system permease small subunit